MDREAWHAVIHGVTKTRTQLSDWTDWTYANYEIYKITPTVYTQWKTIACAFIYNGRGDGCEKKKKQKPEIGLFCIDDTP